MLDEHDLSVLMGVNGYGWPYRLSDFSHVLFYTPLFPTGAFARRERVYLQNRFCKLLIYLRVALDREFQSTVIFLCTDWFSDFFE